jgi:glutamine amidotransferase
MCRLYGFCATEPTKVECTLVHAQNALLAQSENDLTGTSHSEGWGVATYTDGVPHLERQAWAAYHGEHFKRAAAGVYSKTVLAHVRRATVGQPSLKNTHPFISGKWSFAHNGTVPDFKKLRPHLWDRIAPKHRSEIEGETDSEHVFAYVRTLMDETDNCDLSDVMRQTVEDIQTLVDQTGSKRKLGLNMMLTDGKVFYGTRVGRTLYHVERPGVYDCEICGFPHIHHSPKVSYWAAVIASEPLTKETWVEVPDHSLWIATPAEMTLNVSKL